MKKAFTAIATEDNFLVSFTQDELMDFHEFIRDLDKDTVWQTARLSGVTFAPATSVKAENLAMGGDEALSDTARNVAGVVATLPDGRQICMREYLWKQIKQHHRDCAAILGDMLADGRLDAALNHINSGRSFLKKNALFMTRGGKISGWFSQYNANKTQSQQLAILEENLNTNFPNCKFVGGEVSHIYTSAVYQLDTSITSEALLSDTLPAEKVMSAYAKAWVDAGLDANELMRAVPTVTFTTGESGLTSIVISPKLLLPHEEMPLGPSLSVTHRGDDKTVWGPFETFTEQISAMFQQGMKDMERLCLRRIQYPYAAMTRVLKLFASSVSADVLNTLCKDMQMMYDPDEGETCQAIDIVRYVNHMVTSFTVDAGKTAKSAREHSIRRLQNSELVARLYRANWDTFDKPKPVKLNSKELDNPDDWVLS